MNAFPGENRRMKDAACESLGVIGFQLRERQDRAAILKSIP